MQPHAFRQGARPIKQLALDRSGREPTASGTRIRDAAPASCKELFGRAPHLPFTYEDRLSTILPEDRVRVDAAPRQKIELQAEYDVTYRIALPSGQVRWLTSRGQAFTDEGGRTLSMAGVSRDITRECRADRMRAALVEPSDILRKQDDPDEISFSAAELIGRFCQISRQERRSLGQD